MQQCIVFLKDDLIKNVQKKISWVTPFSIPVGDQIVDTILEHTQIPKDIYLYSDEMEFDDDLNLGKIDPFLVFSGFQNPLRSIQYLSHLKDSHPQILRVLCAPAPHPQDLFLAINEAEPFKILPYNNIFEEPNNTETLLKNAYLEYEIRMSNEKRLRESRRHLKELDQLTSKLETTLGEESITLAHAQLEEEESLKKWKSLAHFIESLSKQNSLEELLILLRTKIKKFHEIGESFLIYQLEPKTLNIITYYNSEIVTYKYVEPIQIPDQLEQHHSQWTSVISSLIQRPCKPMTAVPLEISLTKRIGYPNGKALLCVENLTESVVFSQFTDWLKNRKGPLTLAVDRILLEMAFTNYAHRWEKTFDGLNEGICIVNSDYHIIRANRKFINYPTSDLCYKSFANRDTPCEGCPLPSAVRSAQTQNGHVRIGLRYYDVHVYPIFSSVPSSEKFQKHEPFNFVNQYVDITESRELYLRLVQTEKMSAIGLLAGNISHELNNPLTGIRSLAQVLVAQTENNTTLNSDLKEIEKAAARSQKIIKNLLDFSKGSQSEIQEVSLDEVVEKTLPFLKTLMRIHRVKIQLNTSLHRIRINPSLLQQAIFNLISNACQAMQNPGSLEILSQISSSGKDIELHIKDSGPGIPENLIPKIFEPFFTTKMEGQGTGLGLSLSKEIIEKFQGKISVQSQLHQWTLFVVSFPISNLEPSL